MSWHRIQVLYKKDLYWALGNFKLLGIMLLPVLFILVFSQLGDGALFAFNISFINAFIGIFSTSYLIIEEKNKGTLLSLLTTPLRSYELLVSKCLFNLSLCLCVSLFAILFNQRLDLLLSPLALINLALFAGLTCFVGCVVGIFFKNEQEMSVLAPVLMLFFIFGDAIEKSSVAGGVFAFFPDYHITQIFKDQPLELSQRLTHTFFNTIYFMIALVTAAFYTQFYFGNNRERRYSHSLIVGIFALGLALLFSGFMNKPHEKSLTVSEDLNHLKVVSRYWQGRLDFSKDWSLKTLVKTLDHQVHLFKAQQDKSEESVDFSLVIRKAQNTEGSLDRRHKVVRQDPQRDILSRELLTWTGWPAQRLIYLKDAQWVVITEALCQDHLLQMVLEVPGARLNELRSYWTDYRQFIQRSFFTCDPSR